MRLGIIVGQVVATRKNDELLGSKIMIVDPIDLIGKKNGESIIAVDTVGAGVGEKVLFVQGSVASRALQKPNAPVDTSIVAIVDRLDVYE